MPAPTGTFQRPDLGSAYSQFPLWAAKGLVWQDVFPMLPVGMQSANYSVIKAEALLRLEDLRRGPNGGYRRGEYDFIQQSYATVEYGLEEAIDDRQRKLYLYSFDAERYAVEREILRLMMNLEIKVATAAQDTAVITGTAAAASAWSNVASAAPIDDVAAALVALRALNGFDPSQACMVMDWQMYLNLRRSAQILEGIKYSGLEPVAQGKIGPEVLAQVLGVSKIFVAGLMKNTAGRGATRSLTQIWDKTKCLIFHQAGGDIQMPGLGHVFTWTADGGTPDGTFEEYREEQTRSQIIRCRSEFQEKVKDANMGYIITGC